MDPHNPFHDLLRSMAGAHKELTVPEVKAYPQFFAVFKGYICTANKDGSIPLNAKVVCRVDEIDANLMALLLEQANYHAQEWK